VVVLAAGEGTRMKSSTPKVLHQLAGRSLLGHVMAAVTPLEAERMLVVVGHGRDAVAAHLAEIAPAAEPVVQEQQRGTGHATRLALDAVSAGEAPVLVVLGDTPLLRTETLAALLERHAASGSSATVLTARVDDATGYGRILRQSDGRVRAIIEHADADDETRAINEVNSGIYVFEHAALTAALNDIGTDNSQGEEYLTDVIGLLANRGESVEAVVVDDSDDVMGVNDRVQLAQAGSLLRGRINEHWMRSGVTLVDPASTHIGVEVTLANDVVIHPWTILEGTTSIASGASVGPGTHLVDCQVDAGASIRFSTVLGAEIGAGATVGPYTYLRPGTVLAPSAKAGAFVEMKNAQVGAGAKVPHLSYVGDAEIGEGSNIGAATVFVNYDGVDKHRTVIGDHVRIGSDTMLVAPVTIGDGAYTAAGSVITDDVPPGAMGVARARQRTIRDWVLRRRRGTSSADAAEAAQRASGSASGEAGRDTERKSGDNAAGNR
jgi:bifunctional UDP-N-acetylglucosamine pyrophosphorylase/glucosamine-1-phosphate N-acetyltransferase